MAHFKRVLPTSRAIKVMVLSQKKNGGDYARNRSAMNLIKIGA
jgi:hypothetical protein